MFLLSYLCLFFTPLYTRCSDSSLRTLLRFIYTWNRATWVWAGGVSSNTNLIEELTWFHGSATDPLTGWGLTGFEKLTPIVWRDMRKIRGEVWQIHWIFFYQATNCSIRSTKRFAMQLVISADEKCYFLPKLVNRRHCWVLHRERNKERRQECRRNI